MSKKTHKLDFIPNFEFDLIGISSHENDYRLTWAMNNLLYLKLVRSSNLEVNIPQQSVNHNFSKYEYFDDDTAITYYLISNRCDNGFLLDEYKNIDFILLVQGDYEEGYIKDVITRLKSIDLVTIAFEINTKSLKQKSKNKLIF